MHAADKRARRMQPRLRPLDSHTRADKLTREKNRRGEKKRERRRERKEEVCNWGAESIKMFLSRSGRWRRGLCTFVYQRTNRGAVEEEFSRSILEVGDLQAHRELRREPPQ